MKYTDEFDINSFEFWGDAKDVMKSIREMDLEDTVACIIEDVFCDETPTKTQINDFVWFDLPDILEENYDLNIS